jgi:hypothetical protein
MPHLWRISVETWSSIGLMWVVLLSGVGCTSGYESRLQLFHEGLQEFAGGVTAQTLTTHLLSLEDVFAETQAFATAQLDLPDLRDLRD